MAQKLGVPFNLISSVGENDAEARFAITQLKQLRFPLSNVQRVGSTNVFYSLWSPDRHNRELYLSIGSEPTPEFIEAALARDAEGAVIYNLAVTDLPGLIGHCHACGRRIALAPNQDTMLMKRWERSLLAKIELVLMSRAELAALCGNGSLDQGVRCLLAMQGGETAPIFVVTRGFEGIIIVDAGTVTELTGQAAIEFPLGGGDMLALATFVRRLDGAATRAAVEESALHTTGLMREYRQRLASRDCTQVSRSGGSEPQRFGNEFQMPRNDTLVVQKTKRDE